MDVCELPATGGGLSAVVAAVIVLVAGVLLLAAGRRRPPAVMTLLLVAGVLAVSTPAEAASDCPPTTTSPTATTPAATTPTVVSPAPAGTPTNAATSSPTVATVAMVPDSTSSTVAATPSTTATTATTTTTTTTEDAELPVAIGDILSLSGNVGDVVRRSLVANDLNATPLIEVVVIEFEGVNDSDCDGVFFLTDTGEVDVTIAAPAVCRYSYGIETPAGPSNTANVIIYIGVNI